MRKIAPVLCVFVAISASASEHTGVSKPTRNAVENLESVNVLILPIRYVAGKALEESRQRGLKAAGRVTKELELLDERQSLEVKFLLVSDMRALYDNLEDVSMQLGAQSFDLETHQQRATNWMSAVSDAAGPVHDALLALQDELQHDLETADIRLRTCK